MENIIDLYLRGYSYKEISERCGRNEVFIWQTLKKSGIAMRGSGNSKAPKHNPFECLSAEALYWLGYIMADGNITYSKTNYTLVLYSKNKEILEKYNAFTGNLCKIHIWNKQGVYGARLHSKKICGWLITVCNIIPNKALVLNPTLPITWHLLRGYFDGDGSIRLLGDGKEAKFTTGSKVWAERISSFLLNNDIYNVITPKGNAFDINIYRKAESQKLYENMYKDATVWLDYKYNRFVALFGDKQLKIG